MTGIRHIVGMINQRYFWFTAYGFARRGHEIYADSPIHFNAATIALTSASSATYTLP